MLNPVNKYFRSKILDFVLPSIREFNRKSHI